VKKPFVAPLVCVVMLTADRPAFVRRAIRCFLSQTYPTTRRYLYILDSGKIPCTDSLPIDFADYGIVYHRTQGGRSIGALRNYANGFNVDDRQPDYFAHQDDDDWYHQDRLAEQVKLIQEEDVDAVGYRQLLFWQKTGPMDACNSLISHAAGLHRPECGSAWLYSQDSPAYCVGASLLYSRAIWEKRPFPDRHKGEDTIWQMRVRSLGVSAMTRVLPKRADFLKETLSHTAPRMIAAIHPGNTAGAIEPGKAEWSRAREWDGICREAMRL
jgi:glycosyltransferase involved in cell wall biosynthesis